MRGALPGRIKARLAHPRPSHPRLALGAAAAFAFVAVAGCGGSSRSSVSTSVLSKLDVKLPAPARLQAATPPIALRDSTGRPTQLSQFRGKAVLLTFIYTHCPDVCPLIVADLHNALLRLGAEASRLQIIAVSVDPRGDTPASVRAFLAAHDMADRMRYLIGSFRQLAPASPDRRESTVGHSAFLYGITGRGKAVVLYPPTLDPAWIVHDVPILAAY